MWCRCLTPCRICRRRATAFLDSRHGRPEQTPGAARHRQDREPGAVDRPDVPRRVAATPNAEAFRFPDHDGWTSITWRQVGDRVELVAAGLIALGINPEERVALASATRYEWVVVDFAVLCAGAATTTVYPTTNAEDVAFIVANSGSRVVVAENQTQVDKLVDHRAELPDVQKVVLIDGKATVTG
jgi:long-chain acyl-CoA synthetase